MPKVAAAEPIMNSLIIARENPAADCEGPSSLESDTTIGMDVSDASQLDAKQPLVEKLPQPVTPESPREASEFNSVPIFQMPVISDEHKANEGHEGYSGKTFSDGKAEGTTREQEPAKADIKGGNDTPTDAKMTTKKESIRSANTKSRRPRARHNHQDDEGSSSDDDSYFAKNLPSPKSGRSFSYDRSSAGSAVPTGTGFYQNSAGRESDASLSFSDESEEDKQQQGVHIPPMIPQQGTVAANFAEMNLYPQRITRMHSVSSLVSSDSSDSNYAVPPAAEHSEASSVSSEETSGTSDPSLRAEIHDFGVKTRPGSQLTDISGRRSPVMGQHGIPGYFYTSPSPVMSPLPIMQRYAAPQGLSHPAPQPMSQEQLAIWAFNNVPSSQYATNQQQSYGATSQATDFRHDDDRSQFFRGFSGGNVQAGVRFPHQEDLTVGSYPDELHQAAGQYRGRGRIKDASDAGTAAVGTSDGVSMEPLARKFSSPGERGYKVYWQRWLMLTYMSVLNLLSDWTCYSVAPISMLTEEAFGNIDPERLVVVFLSANAIASISEPVILSRLGLRRTVLFGALLLMIGSIIKSGGVPPILQSDIIQGESAWRLYLGFFLVGLSQPLYQCTPTLLSSSWFPEEERTMATGVALNANQLGIGFAFVVGTLLVASKDDIIPYFGLLSSLSTIVFLGALIQFDDAPPTPPSASARVMRGTFDVKLPSINTIVESVRDGFTPASSGTSLRYVAAAPSPVTNDSFTTRQSERSARRRTGSRSAPNKESGLKAPSSAHPGSTASAIAEMARIKAEAAGADAVPPSPIFSGPSESKDQEQKTDGEPWRPYHDISGMPQHREVPGEHPMLTAYPGVPPPGMASPGMMPYPYPYPYWDPRMQQLLSQQSQYQQHTFYPPPPYYIYQQSVYPPPPHPYYFPDGAHPPPYLAGYDFASAAFPEADDIDDGAEPILTITPHHLDIDIKDDQVIRSLKACFARQGFIHALVAFTASGIVINTLSTYMDYLVRLNGAPRAYTGIVGGAFQFIIMISSLIIGVFTDKSRAYYSVTIGMLVLGAFALAECGVSLDADKGNDLRLCLVIVAALVGPLQPVSTELGVDVVYPLSENTVLVIQQLFSNLLSALFIPVFKALKHVGSTKIDDAEMFERPEYTFSFYLLIVIHTAATVFFATFNGKYLRYEHELERKAEEEEEDERQREGEEAMHPFFRGHAGESDERKPLVSSAV